MSFPSINVGGKLAIANTAALVARADGLVDGAQVVVLDSGLDPYGTGITDVPLVYVYLASLANVGLPSGIFVVPASRVAAGTGAWFSHDAALGQPLWSDTFWDDLVVPATLVNLAGPPAAPAYNAIDLTVDFSSSAINTVQFVYQLPHAWKEESNVHFHIHAFPSNTNGGNVVWEWKWRWTSILGVAGAWDTSSAPEAMSGVEDRHAYMAAKTIPGAGHTISSILQVQLQRLGNDGADSFTGLVQMLSADVHFERDRPGSRQETVK